MPSSRFLSLLLAALLVSVSARPQQPIAGTQRNGQAISLLQQVLLGAGGATALSKIQDYTAVGTITYFWAGEEVSGTVTVRGRGPNQFRLDANLPAGTRSWTLSNGTGALRETDGKLTSIPYQTLVSLNGLTLPFVSILAALQDSSTTVAYLGLVDVGAGVKAHQIQIQPNLYSPSDDSGKLTSLGRKDFFVDPVTFRLLLLQDTAYPTSGYLQEYWHRVQFSDYRQVAGMILPFSITEEISGQRTWTIHLDTINVNSGLADADFQF